MANNTREGKVISVGSNTVLLDYFGMPNEENKATAAHAIVDGDDVLYVRKSDGSLKFLALS